MQFAVDCRKSLLLSQDFLLRLVELYLYVAGTPGIPTQSGRRKAVAALVRRGPPPSRFFASLPTRARQTRRAEFARVRHRMRRPHACAPVALP